MARKLHGLPGTGPNQTLEEIRPAITTSPEHRRSGGRPAPPPPQNSRRQRARRRAKRDATPCANRTQLSPIVRPAASLVDQQRRNIVAREARNRGLWLQPSRYGGQATCATFARSGAHHRPHTTRQARRSLAQLLAPVAASLGAFRAAGARPSARPVRAPEMRGPPYTGGGRAANLKVLISILKNRKLDTIWHNVLIRSENHDSDTTVGIRIAPPDEAAEEQKIQVPGDDQYDEQYKIYDIHRVFKITTLLATRAWLRPVS
ncbi:hypothetical protein F511_45298 [Dorcoceras hygrometricum]|uniref:Uncharacterized protein n=1 Tax=Dorcoceras hygrometricum TaxID=472368 RepID=A0A2Z7A3X0_9LAMI|nr:hypothetical protein F511_45298 [Dorcoceras hygrometricum]